MLRQKNLLFRADQSVGVSLDLSGVYVDGLGDVETEGGASASPAKSAG